MGTYATAEVYASTPGAAERAVLEIRNAFERVDLSMSNWRDDSELSALNRAAAFGPWRVQDPDLYGCIEIALAYARLTDGAFDPTVGPLMRLWGFRPFAPRVPVPGEIAEALGKVGWEKVRLFPSDRALCFLETGMELDLGGIAKGHALDIAARALSRPGCRAGLLDLGGNLYVWGRPPGALGWRIGVRAPGERPRLVAEVGIADRALATSGIDENSFTVDGTTYGHIMDRTTGHPVASDVIAATAIADRGVDADAWSTILFAAGSRRGADLLERAHRVEAVLLVRSRRGVSLLASGSLRGRLVLDPDFAPEVGGEIDFLLPPVSLGRPTALPAQ